ncbi:MAG: translation initiation factor IF-2 N-terminal domain-containing protein, partial [Clostridia bacterium]|nr:translation initiation factor IF-2 N-terminal domain-containing protein [Clostridia bacterium]
MPREKYRIHEVAKDFGSTSKKVIEILEKISDEPKKHTTILEDRELDYIFETITQANEVSSFDAYFAAGEAQKAAKTEAKKAEDAPVKAEPEKKEEKAPDAENKAPAKAKKSDKKPEGKKEAPKAEKKAEEKKAQAPVQQPKKEQKEKLIQSRTKGEKRHVDTRSSNVDLEKYNEKYDEMASQGGRRDHEMGSTKQKLKQKSQQYRKQQGTRSSKRETEAERLKRIAAERAKKTLTVKIPNEITVG